MFRSALLLHTSFTYIPNASWEGTIGLVGGSESELKTGVDIILFDECVCSFSFCLPVAAIHHVAIENTKIMLRSTSRGLLPSAAFIRDPACLCVTRSRDPERSTNSTCGLKISTLRMCRPGVASPRGAR